MELSIVVPAFKATATIARTLGSCIDQVPQKNIFVVLDGPDEALEAAAREAAPDAKIIVLREKSGAPVCRNTGLARVVTPYVMFLDADDYLEGAIIRGASKVAAERRSDVVLAPFAFEWPDGRRQIISPSIRYQPCDNRNVLRRWLCGEYVPPCSVVWRTDFVRKIGGWDESLAKNQDGDLIYRALMRRARLTTCDEGLGVYSQDDNPLRITRTVTHRTLSSQIAVLNKVRNELPALGYEPAEALSRAYYSVARLAFGAGIDELGQQAEDTARELGLKGQPGSLPHLIVAALFGLRRKQRIATLVKSSIPHRPVVI